MVGHTQRRTALCGSAIHHDYSLLLLLHTCRAALATRSALYEDCPRLLVHGLRANR